MATKRLLYFLSTNLPEEKENAGAYPGFWKGGAQFSTCPNPLLYLLQVAEKADKREGGL